VHGMHAATSTIENSAQGLPFKLKFVHAMSRNDSISVALLKVARVIALTFTNGNMALLFSPFLYILQKPQQCNYNNDLSPSN
jgi:hypothetical protein